MDIEKLNEAVKKSVNYSEVCSLLYGNNNYGNRKTIKKYIELENINIDHFIFISRNSNVENFKGMKIDDILVENSTYNSSTTLKKRLYKEGLKKRKCEECGLGEEWRGKKMSLILDHKNGVNNDNRINNLRILCPNCNATLPTHGGKNNKSYVRLKKNYKIFTENKKIESKKIASKKQRKVERPSYEVLLHDIKMFGYTGTGEKYGVSDNAIRKWKKFYEKYD